VHLETVFGWHPLGDAAVRGRRRPPRRNPPEPPGYAQHVGVDRKDRPSQREAEHAGRRLHAHAIEAGQIVERLAVRHLFEVTEIGGAPLLREPFQRPPDRARLLRREPGDTDRLLELRSGGAPDIVPGRVALP